jgi:hypothetical protein
MSRALQEQGSRHLATPLNEALGLRQRRSRIAKCKRIWREEARFVSRRPDVSVRLMDANRGASGHCCRSRRLAVRNEKRA